MDTKIKPKNIEFNQLTYTVPIKNGEFYSFVFKYQYFIYEVQTQMQCVSYKWFKCSEF